MEQARLGDRVEGGYDRLLAEIRNTSQRLEQGFERLEQKIEETGDLKDQRLARHLAWQRFWLAGVIIGTAATMGGLAAAGVI